MTQYAAAPPPPQPAPAPVVPAVVLPAGAGTPAPKTVVDTPKLLNQWQLIGVTVAILFGVVSALLQFLAWQSDGQAADDTEQLVRVQEIQSTLLHADALATNSFLAGANAEGDQQADYDAELASVFEQIADAADAQPADREALAALNVAVNEYATAVAEARVNNRQGFPVGAEYLSAASTALRDYPLPILRNLAETNSERAEDAMGGQHPILLILTGIAAVAALVWINQMLAARFRRRVNVGAAVAALIVVAVTLVSAAVAIKGDGQNDALLDDELRSAVDQAAARTAANDAKANESLRLIKRGSGELYEEPWRASAAVVEERADESTLDEWQDYVDRHAEIVAYDDEDRWLLARGIAIGEGKDGSTAPFEAFDARSKEIVEDMAGETTQALRAGRTLALVGSGLTLLLGFVAAIAVARGIAARRREYA